MFADDVDRTDFCNRLAKMCRANRWTCLGFVLMRNHYHLIVSVEADVLQSTMRWLNGTYAQRFNGRHKRWGHLCGSRYSIVPIRSARQLRRAFRYVALNPVRAGVVRRPEDWPWSSYAGSAGLSELRFAFVDDARLLAYFGDGEPARSGLRDFVEEALTKSLPGTVPG